MDVMETVQTILAICGGISVLDSRESGYNEGDSNERK